MHELADLQPILDKYKSQKGSLITVLQKAQDIYGHLSINLLNHIAVQMDIKPSKVLGVATFYTQFRMEPVGKNLILLCQGTACHVNGSVAIEQAVAEELGVAEGKMTEDGLFTYNNVACIGCCSLAPAMVINGETYGNLTPAQAKKVIQELRKEA